MSDVVKTNKPPFAARAQRINIYLLIVALLMLAQQFTYTIYLWGFRLLFVVVTLQVALGNINPDWDGKKNLKEDFGNSLGDCSNFRVFHICHTVFDRARQT